MPCSAFRFYATLIKPLSERHMLQDVAKLAVLLDDPIRVRFGLEKRRGQALPFNRPVSFGQGGSFIQLYQDQKPKNALGESIPQRVAIGQLRPSDRRPARETFWRPLLRTLQVGTGQIDYAAIFASHPSTGLPIEMMGGFNGVIFFGSAERSYRDAYEEISQEYPHGRPYLHVSFRRDPATMDVQTVQNLVCDIVALLQLGYSFDTFHPPNEKIVGMAWLLKSILEQSGERPEDLTAIVRRNMPEFAPEP